MYAFIVHNVFTFISFFRLCGYEPFFDEDDARIFKKIIKGDYEFDPPYWDDVSENAKVRNTSFYTLQKHRLDSKRFWDAYFLPTLETVLELSRKSSKYCTGLYIIFAYLTLILILFRYTVYRLRVISRSVSMCKLYHSPSRNSQTFQLDN